MGMQQINWIKDVVAKWDKDPNILWRVSVQHHPLFGKWYTDFQPLTKNYLPILLKHNFDLYLNGHEHHLSHSFYNFSQGEFDVSKNKAVNYIGDQCQKDLELKYSDASKLKYSRGEVIH